MDNKTYSAAILIFKMRYAIFFMMVTLLYGYSRHFSLVMMIKVKYIYKWRKCVFCTLIKIARERKRFSEVICQLIKSRKIR